MRSLFLWAGLALLSSGCAGRQILSVEDADAGGGTTIISTIESKNYLLFASAKLVWWECGESAGGLVCEKRCDVRDDTGDMLKCNKLTVF